MTIVVWFTAVEQLLQVVVKPWPPSHKKVAKAKQVKQDAPKAKGKAIAMKGKAKKVSVKSKGTLWKKPSQARTNEEAEDRGKGRGLGW